MDEWEKLTREQARALIAKHKIVALESNIEQRRDGSTYELDHNQFFRLGNGRLLWRQDSCDECGEEWLLVIDVIDGTASDTPRALGA